MYLCFKGSPIILNKITKKGSYFKRKMFTLKEVVLRYEILLHPGKK